MRELPAAVPVDVLLALEPEELEAKLLFLVRRRKEHMFHPSGMTTELWGHDVPADKRYPHNQKGAVELALIEAWHWLEAQGLILPAPDENGRNGYRILSRRARRFEHEGEFDNYAAARRLPQETLNPRIREKVWMSFMRGDFDTAAFQALKAVEVAVREAAGLAKSDIGVALVRKAFDVKNGPLTDTNAEPSERQARSDLFAGSIGSYKNPQSHRDVDLDDPAEAAEIVMLANHLLRIVDARGKAKKKP